MRMPQSGPEGQAHPAAWRRWLLPLGGTAVILSLLALPWRTAQGMMLSYSQFLADVGAGTVKAVIIDPAGQGDRRPGYRAAFHYHHPGRAR